MTNKCKECIYCFCEYEETIDGNLYQAYSCDKGWIPFEHEECKDFKNVEE